MSKTLVWYVSYGSNLLRERFDYYINGGHLKDYNIRHRGCPDKTPPRDDIALHIPGELYFASHIDHWQGFTAAFIDPERTDKTVKARGYLITLEQFEHVLAQECNTMSLISVDLKALQKEGQLVIGKGEHFFNRLVCLGEHEGRSLITFTTVGEHMTRGEPSQAYANVVMQGLSQSHGLTRQEALEYIAASRRREHLAVPTEMAQEAPMQYWQRAANANRL